MARFALRNQHLIIKSLGLEFNKLLLESLKTHFNSNVEIKENVYSDKYSTVHVNNTQNIDSFFEFYVIRKTYDVYILAYK